MRILVTGGAGYVGCQVTGHLLQAGFAVTVFDKLIYGGEALLPFHRLPSFRLVRGDVRDPSGVAAALRGVDAVVHLAAVVGEPACNVDPDQAWSINLGGTENILTQAVRAGVARIVFISTCSNYGVASPNALATEESPLNPLSLYARAKVEAEKLFLAVPPPCCATVLRFGTICGLSGRMRFDLLVSEMALKAVRGQPIEIFAPEASRPFLHIGDAGRAIEHVLRAPTKSNAGRVFNVVGENYRKRGLVELVHRHFPQANVAIVDKSPDLRDYQVDGSRITRELGFATSWTVEDAFVETARAIESGVFRDPEWRGHSAIPLDPEQLRP